MGFLLGAAPLALRLLFQLLRRAFAGAAHACFGLGSALPIALRRLALPLVEARGIGGLLRLPLGGLGLAFPQRLLTTPALLFRLARRRPSCGLARRALALGIGALLLPRILTGARRFAISRRALRLVIATAGIAGGPLVAFGQRNVAQYAARCDLTLPLPLVGGPVLRPHARQAIVDEHAALAVCFIGLQRGIEARSLAGRGFQDRPRFGSAGATLD
ncbi:MAG: hypothetical protein AB7L76_04270 [Burkholderiaceae bacterium]